MPRIVARNGTFVCEDIRISHQRAWGLKRFIERLYPCVILMPTIKTHGRGRTYVVMSLPTRATVIWDHGKWILRGYRSDGEDAWIYMR